MLASRNTLLTIWQALHWLHLSSCCHPPTQPHTLCLLQIKTYVIDNTTVTGVHTVDLTLAELKQVRVRERTFERSQAFNDFLPVMTFEECATMARVRAGVSPSAVLCGAISNCSMWL
jgi:hypothetical protein